MNDQWQLTWATFTATGACMGAFLVYLQLRASQKLAKAQFVHGLTQGFLSYEKTYRKLTPGGPWSNTGAGPLEQQDIDEIALYLSFFESIEMMLRARVIDIRTVDPLFALRFFQATHNRHVQESILYRTPYYRESFPAIFSLHKRWADHRLKTGRPAPTDGPDLRSYDAKLYDEMVTQDRRWE